ncbi:M12 family metallo-peptidase, partial [Porticoccaceae bacterium]|nr:M12 family metallo-peptidase [Porticoccaceae bacterium]
MGAFCDDDVKGSAWSASSQPEGSEFVNLVAHEMGHQLGANHTFSMRTEGTGVNVEPASGTTIMSYAGTGEDNVAFFADNYYHNVSILQGLSYLKAQSCHVNQDIDNTVPSVAPLKDYTIPVGTPFVLTGSATDVDENDVLTYTWEQVDNGLVPSSVFGPENNQGANFRSLPPSENPTRYFPLITSVVSGDLTLTNPYVGSTWETLSSVPREFNFAFTARDNALGGGGVASARTKITVVDSGGAFSVTSQENGQLYLAASEQTITWALAGTDAAPILTDLVNIRLSVDGGLTYPYTLAENINNDGSHTVFLPDVVTSAARVRVDAVDNVYYAINARDFSITRDDIVLTYDELDYAVCNNESTT